MRLGSKTYLDLPSLGYDYEYSIVICADDDEYAGRNKIIQKVRVTSDALCPLPMFADINRPRRPQFASLEDPGIIRPGTSAGAGYDGRCRKLLDISGRQTTVELLEMGPETDQAMLRYQIEYAEAFAFVFSLYSPKTLETAQTLYDKVQGAARSQQNVVTMSDYDKAAAAAGGGGVSVPVFLIGNRDGDLAPPQGEFSFSELDWLAGVSSRPVDWTGGSGTGPGAGQAGACVAIVVPPPSPPLAPILPGATTVAAADTQTTTAEMEEGDFSPTAFNERAEAEMRVQRDRAKELAQQWGCAYFEVDTSAKRGEHGVDEAITGIGHFIKAAERPSTSSTASFRAPMKPPKQYRIRRFLGRMGRMTSFS